MTKQITNPSFHIFLLNFYFRKFTRWIQDEAAGYPARQGWAGPYVVWIFTPLQSDLTGLGRAQLPLAPSPSQIAAQQPVSCLNWCVTKRVFRSVLFVVSSRIWIRIISGSLVHDFWKQNNTVEGWGAEDVRCCHFLAVLADDVVFQTARRGHFLQLQWSKCSKWSMPQRTFFTCNGDDVTEDVKHVFHVVFFSAFCRFFLLGWFAAAKHSATSPTSLHQFLLETFFYNLKYCRIKSVVKPS